MDIFTRLSPWKDSLDCFTNPTCRRWWVDEMIFKKSRYGPTEIGVGHFREFVRLKNEANSNDLLSFLILWRAFIMSSKNPFERDNTTSIFPRDGQDIKLATLPIVKQHADRPIRLYANTYSLESHIPSSGPTIIQCDDRRFLQWAEDERVDMEDKVAFMALYCINLMRTASQKQDDCIRHIAGQFFNDYSEFSDRPKPPANLVFGSRQCAFMRKCFNQHIDRFTGSVLSDILLDHYFPTLKSPVDAKKHAFYEYSVKEPLHFAHLEIPELLHKNFEPEMMDKILAEGPEFLTDTIGPYYSYLKAVEEQRSPSPDYDLLPEMIGQTVKLWPFCRVIASHLRESDLANRKNKEVLAFVIGMTGGNLADYFGLQDTASRNYFEGGKRFIEELRSIGAQTQTNA